MTENAIHSSIEGDAWPLKKNRLEFSNTETSLLAKNIVDVLGLSKTLNIGCSDGRLIVELLKYGVDAHGVAGCDFSVNPVNDWLADRLRSGLSLPLPFEDESFENIVSIDFLERVPQEAISTILAEFYRIAKSSIFLQVQIRTESDDASDLNFQNREWWETRLFEAGFRKHASYYKINDYVSLQSDAPKILILLEKIPTKQLTTFATQEFFKLEMHDALRESGVDSDATLIRYVTASGFVKPGDRVLDAACGLGFGSHVIRRLAQPGHVLGVELRDEAIAYAKIHYGGDGQLSENLQGVFPEILASYESGSFDAIVAFGVLDHVEDTPRLIAEFHRVLTPGGRLILSTSNTCGGISSQDRHGYDWRGLKDALGRQFILESAFAQTATRCKGGADGNSWQAQDRFFQPVPWTETAPADCEWWLMVGMKTPLEAGPPYVERVFANIADSGHPSVQYSRYFANPWLMHSMVNAGYRLKNTSALELLAKDVMVAYAPESSDYAAALCVLAYSALDRGDTERKRALISAIDQFVEKPLENPMALRWHVSVLFVKASLQEKLGELSEAMNTYLMCSKIDVLPFGVHLSTKTTEAAFRAGKLAYALGFIDAARHAWTHGANLGTSLLSVDLNEVLINPDFPNLFNHGDGVREYSVAWDNIARCANGLHLLQRSSALDFPKLNNSHLTEYAGVTADVIRARESLIDRTNELVDTRAFLVERTKELVETRTLLVERTTMLERASQELIIRTEELIATRATVTERTRMLEQASRDLISRTEELVANRATLKERTEMLELLSRGGEFECGFYLSNLFIGKKMNLKDRILVTGAKGLVGSALVEHMKSEGYENIIEVGRHECDLVDSVATRKFFEEQRPEYIFHAAARVYGIMGNMKNKALSFYDNVMINTNVVDAAQKVGVKKITVMGTGAVYPFPSPGLPLKEDMIFLGEPHAAENSYAHAKRAMLAMLRAYEESYGMEWAYVVSCNLFGPRDKFDIEFGHVVPSLIKKFYDAKQSGSNVVVWGDGSARRDFMYVKDTARVGLAIMNNITGAANIGSGTVYRIRDIVEMIADITGMADKVVWDAEKPNGQDYRAYDLTKIDSIGFKCQYSIKAGLEETWNWYSKQASESQQ